MVFDIFYNNKNYYENANASHLISKEIYLLPLERPQHFSFSNNINRKISSLLQM